MICSYLFVTFVETFNKIRDTHTSYEVYRDKLHGERCSVLLVPLQFQ